MKKFLFIIMTFLMVACQEFDPSNNSIAYYAYQSNKFECVNENLAYNTNLYGMGNNVTRTTDGGNYANWKELYDIYCNETLTTAEPVDDAWWVLLIDNTIYCNHSGEGESKVDMPGFNAGDQPGKCVYIAKNEQKINFSKCTNGIEYHQPSFKYYTYNNITFVEIHAYDSNEDNVLCKVYATFDFKITNTYLLCIEDLGGSNLDFNDVVILGGQNMKPRVIYRMASLPLTITADNITVELDGDMYGEYDIELPFNNMNTPNDWKNATFKTENGIIPVLLKNMEDMPAVIATDVLYNYHKDENTMTSSEFASIPFYGK